MSAQAPNLGRGRDQTTAPSSQWPPYLSPAQQEVLLSPDIKVSLRKGLWLVQVGSSPTPWIQSLWPGDEWLQLVNPLSCERKWKSESEVDQLCLTLCDPVDCSPPGSFIHGILHARILEWVAISFSRGSSQPRDWAQVSCIAGRCFNLWATRWPPPIGGW